MAQYGAKELATAFRTVRGNTLQVAREIPEDKYDFVAAPGVRSVSQLLRHIAYADMIYYDFHRDKHIDTLKGYDFGAFIARSTAEEAKPLDRDESSRSSSSVDRPSRAGKSRSQPNSSARRSPTTWDRIRKRGSSTLWARRSMRCIIAASSCSSSA